MARAGASSRVDDRHRSLTACAAYVHRTGLIGQRSPRSKRLRDRDRGYRLGERPHSRKAPGRRRRGEPLMNGSSRVADPWADEHSGTRTLDLALGVLVGLRRCDAKEAFSGAGGREHPTRAVAVRTRPGLGGGGQRLPVPDSDAGAAVAEEWGELFVDTRVST